MFGNSGIFESEYFVKNPYCSIDYAHCQGRAGTFPETQTQVKYRFEPKVIEHSPMSGFLRAVAGKEEIHGSGAQGVGNQGSGRRDEPVNYDGTPVVGAGQDAPGDAPDFEPSHFGQGIQTVCRIRAVYFNSLPYYLTLILQGILIDSCPSAHHLIHGSSRQDRAKGGRGSRVADPHITGSKEPDAARN
jgi:hypothetical protein